MVSSFGQGLNRMQKSEILVLNRLRVLGRVPNASTQFFREYPLLGSCVAHQIMM